jgi:hypothetical protein
MHETPKRGEQPTPVDIHRLSLCPGDRGTQDEKVAELGSRNEPSGMGSSVDKSPFDELSPRDLAAE